MEGGIDLRKVLDILDKLILALLIIILSAMLVVGTMQVIWRYVLEELNRAPFDFSEGESELVSGYNVEYGSVSYALLYIGEYGSLLFFSMLFSFLFFNSSFLVFYFFFCLLIFVRSSYPRFRYDIMIGFF